jgi:hypothetical protein
MSKSWIVKRTVIETFYVDAPDKESAFRAAFEEGQPQEAKVKGYTAKRDWAYEALPVITK